MAVVVRAELKHLPADLAAFVEATAEIEAPWLYRDIAAAILQGSRIGAHLFNKWPLDAQVFTTPPVLEVVRRALFSSNGIDAVSAEALLGRIARRGLLGAGAEPGLNSWVLPAGTHRRDAPVLQPLAGWEFQCSSVNISFKTPSGRQFWLSSEYERRRFDIDVGRSVRVEVVGASRPVLVRAEYIERAVQGWAAGEASKAASFAFRSGKTAEETHSAFLKDAEGIEAEALAIAATQDRALWPDIGGDGWSL